MRILCWPANEKPPKPERGSASSQLLLLLLPYAMGVEGMAAPAFDILSLSAEWVSERPDSFAGRASIAERPFVAHC